MGASTLGYFWMQASAPSGSPFGQLMFTVVGMILIIWLLFIRPQRKEQQRHQTMVDALKRGDRVATAGGLVGEIVKVEKKVLILRSGDSKVEVERHRVARRLDVPEESEE